MRYLPQYFVLIFFFLVVFHFPCHSQRQKVSLNSGWQFILNDDSAFTSSQHLKNNWQKINLPHTWNAADIVDDSLGYHQGIGWYKKNIYLPGSQSPLTHSLYFEGLGNVGTVFINGKEQYRHAGSFSGFSTGPLNLDTGINEIVIRADNSKSLQRIIPPYSADFNIMGGIYRDLWWISTGANYFSGNYGSNGILFSTPEVDSTKAIFHIEPFVMLEENAGRKFLRYQLSLDGRIVAENKKPLTQKTKQEKWIGKINNPKLWSPEAPMLYELSVQILNSDNKILDEVVQQVGFKWVGINSKREFTLNGKPYKLKGASRHQDYAFLGNALPDAIHRYDMRLMKEMGCNFIRIAHYPQDPAIFEACNTLGLIAWCEIPVVDRVENNTSFLDNTKLMMNEMIWQNFNHPCIAMWGYHNEVRNLDSVSLQNAQALNNIAKSLDSNRLTAMAFESNIDAPYFSHSLLGDMLNIADINGYNVYQGWYRGRHESISNFLDTLHNFNNKKPILLSEYGAGSIINMHTYKPGIFDFSEEYQWQYHRSYLNAGNKKPWLAGFAIWNFIDFQRDGREDVVPNINKKGMVTAERKRKDAFYFYKSQWSNEPFIYITGKNWQERTGITGPQKNITIPVVVFSNEPELRLFQDGKLLGLRTNQNDVFTWEANLHEGKTNFYCLNKDGSLSDALTINYHLVDSSNFTTYQFPVALHFNTGQSHTFFTDTKSREQWMPDKEYSRNNWGYVGGKIWNTWPSPAWNGLREGIHRPIALTENEPVFQTFVQGLTNWKADIAAGTYRVSVMLAEPFTRAQRDNKKRIFSILLNNKSWMKQVDLEKDYGILTAVIFDKIVHVEEGEGINISFVADEGQTILNGITIQKL